MPGVYRTHLFQVLASLREENFTVEELLSADEVWLTNAYEAFAKCQSSRLSELPKPNDGFHARTGWHLAARQVNAIFVLCRTEPRKSNS